MMRPECTNQLSDIASSAFPVPNRSARNERVVGGDGVHVIFLSANPKLFLSADGLLELPRRPFENG